MRIEVTIAKSTVLPAGALDALAGELSRRISSTFPENDGAVTVRYATANHLSVIGGAKEDKERICRFNWSTQQLCENMGLRR
ncbi:hypothetical protein SS45_19030, partial [Enterobacter hormaechei subsp. steigerwaltii]|uniref:DinI-like family protein n=1 Tax=Enterobacter hormaechei TaxID=158836 RepID=UPI0005EE93C9